MSRRGCSLLVRNLRYETSPEKVREVFEKIGRVKDVYLPLDHSTREPRGFGFVEYFDEADAQAAVREFDRWSLDGNELSVIIAQDRRKSPRTMRRIIGERQTNGHGRNGPTDGRGPGREIWESGNRSRNDDRRSESGRSEPYDGSRGGGLGVYRDNGGNNGNRNGDRFDNRMGSDGRRPPRSTYEGRQQFTGRSRSRSRHHEDRRGDRRYCTQEALRAKK